MSVDPHEHEPAPFEPAPFDPATWADAPARATLQLIAASVAQMAGFEVAVISAVRDETIVSVAIEGDEEVRRSLTELRTPLATILNDLELADDWGRFQFISHEVATDDDYRWIPDFVPSDAPDAWHPLDALLAPLRTEAGELIGVLSIDLPLSGCRPDAAQLDLLQRYAAQAEQALLNALERDELAQRLRLAEVARQVVRIAVSQPDIGAALQECRPALLDGFRADDLTIRTYADEFGPSGGTPPLAAVSEPLRQLLRDLARTCWSLQRVGILAAGWHDSDLVDVADHDALRQLLTRLGFASAMVVPIGAGPHCLGHLILMRTDARTPWTADERDGALEVARDIGHAALAARNLAGEQRLVRELRELGTYKTQLLATVSHELKNPLGSIAGHLELVAESADLADDTRFSIGAMERATKRLTRLVDDLLTLARLEDPDRALASVQTDLRPAVESALESVRFAAERRDLRLRLEVPDGSLPLRGDPEGVERVLVNLVSNAVKYTPRCGAVSLTVTRHAGEVEVAVADEGIGISEEDQAHLFAEFFRSTNPAALAEPGTGLGLAISARIMAGLGGRITVESTLGAGSTFRAFFPTPTSPADSAVAGSVGSTSSS